MPAARHVAIVLAGGRATRLGGADKARVEMDGQSLLERVVQALSEAAAVVVVGPEHLALPGARIVREEPAFGGPVAALDAAMSALGADAASEVRVLACDLARPVALVALLDAVPLEADAVIPIDAEGRLQPLAARYRTTALRAALARLDSTDGAPMRRVLDELVVQTVLDEHGASADLDTWDDIEDLRASGAAPEHTAEERMLG